MPEARLLRSKQKTWLFVETSTPGSIGAKEMLSVDPGEFVLQEVGGRPSLDDTAQFRWVYVIHTMRGVCRAIDDHWEVWGEDTLGP